MILTFLILMLDEDSYTQLGVPPGSWTKNFIKKELWTDWILKTKEFNYILFI